MEGSFSFDLTTSGESTGSREVTHLPISVERRTTTTTMTATRVPKETRQKRSKTSSESGRYTGTSPLLPDSPSTLLTFS